MKWNIIERNQKTTSFVITKPFYFLHLKLAIISTLFILILCIRNDQNVFFYFQDYHVHVMWRSLFSWIRLRASAGAAKLLFIWRRKEYRDRNPTRRWYQKKGWGCSLVLPWCNGFSVRFNTFCILRYSFYKS